MTSLFSGEISPGGLTTRRGALSALGAAAMGASGLPTAAHAAVPSSNGGIDYTDPKDNLYAFAKMLSSFDEPVIGCFHGLMYMRWGTNRMVPAFGYEGTGVLQARWEPDGTLSRRSRETGYFTDLRTGEVLETWENPFTGETVEVYHFYNPLLVRRMDEKMSLFNFAKDTDSPNLMNE